MNIDHTKMPIICLLGGPMPLREEENATEFWVLSNYCHGFVLSPVWKNGRRAKGGGPCACLGSFEYYTTDTARLPTFIRVAANFFFYIRKGLQLRKRLQYKVIVSYGPFTNAWAGYVLKKLTGAKLIVEFPGNPMNSFLLDSFSPTFIDRLKTWFSKITSPMIPKIADHVRLLFPGQLDGVARVPRERTSSFHYFTPIQDIIPSNETANYILCLGGPWYRKGVDVLIKAFFQIADQFPQVTLRVHGYGAGREYFEQLAQGHPRIEIGRPVPHSEALELIKRCRLFACPSRSEGFPRVLNEAMAAGRPVVAAKVDGIPHYVTDNVNGLLFKSEDVEELAEKMRVCLGNPDVATRLGREARKYAMQHLTDGNYAEAYWRMLQTTLSTEPDTGRCKESNRT